MRDCSLPLQTTWLGHACFLNQLYGVNILLDPVFSKRYGAVTSFIVRGSHELQVLYGAMGWTETFYPSSMHRG